MLTTAATYKIKMNYNPFICIYVQVYILEIEIKVTSGLQRMRKVLQISFSSRVM